MARKLEVQIVGDASSLQKAFGQAGKSSSGLSRVLGGALKVGMAGAVAGMAGLGAAAKIGFDEFQGAAKISAQTAAAIQATGGAANVSKKHVQDLAGSLLNLSGVDDEAIQGSENLLLTFKNIKNVGANKIFDQTTRAVLDMDTAMTQGESSASSLKGTSILVGKALNDPIKGLSALSRVGVTFTESQKASIKAMVDSGNAMGAQKVILKELNSEFGGSAKAIGDSMPGSLNKIREAFNNAAGSAIEGLIPALTGLADWTNANMPTIQAVMTTAFATVGTAITELVDIGGGLIDFYKRHTTLVQIGAGAVAGMTTAIVAISAVTKAWAAAQFVLNAVLTANPIGVVVMALAALAGGLTVAYMKSETFRGIVQGAFHGVELAVGAMKTAITSTINAFQAVLSWTRANWPIIATIVSGPFAPLVALATDAFGIRSAMIGAFKAMLSAASSFGHAIADAIRAPFNAVIAAWNGLSIPGFNVHIAIPHAPDINFGWGGMSLPDIPSLDVGGRILSDGMFMGHRGETVVPARAASPFSGGIPDRITLDLGGSLIDMVRVGKARYERVNGPGSF